MALGNNVTWLQDGEKANALVLNRPLKEALTEIDAKIIELENKLQNGGTGSGGTGSGGTGSGGTGSGGTGGTGGSNNSAEIQAIQTEIQNLKNAQTQLQNKQNELEGKVNQLQQNQGSGGSGSDGGSGNQGSGSTQTPTLPNLQQNEVELRAGTKDYNITYTANRALFYCEGILLRPSEYTATNGTSITLTFEPKTGETLTAISL